MGGAAGVGPVSSLTEACGGLLGSSPVPISCGATALDAGTTVCGTSAITAAMGLAPLRQGPLPSTPAQGSRSLPCAEVSGTGRPTRLEPPCRMAKREIAKET